MFTIIGGDGKEYGPATVEQLRAWIVAGRANLDTKAKALGTDEWRRLGDFAEFGSPDAPPPVMSAAGAAGPAGAAIAAPAAGLALPAADRGRRLAARLIDWIIAIAGVTPGFALLGSEFTRLLMMSLQGHQPDFEQMDLAQLAKGGLVACAGWLIVLIVQVVLLSTRSQSIGKVILHIRIVRVVDGAPGGILHAWFLRECLITIIGVISGVIPILGLVLRPAFHLTDWLMIMRADQRCLHDLIAGTRVVAGDPPPRT